MVTLVPRQYRRHPVLPSRHRLRRNSGPFSQTARPPISNSRYAVPIRRQVPVDLFDPNKRAISSQLVIFSRFGGQIRKKLRLWEALLAVVLASVIISGLLTFHTQVDGDTTTLWLALIRSCGFSAVLVTYLRLRYSLVLVGLVWTVTIFWVVESIGLDCAITYLYIY